MEKSIPGLGDTLTRFIEGQKRSSMLFPVGNGIKAGVDTKIIITITKYFAQNHYKDSVKAVGIIMAISMMVSQPPQISHLMPHNPILMIKIRNTPNIGMIKSRMSYRVVVTMRMSVTCLLRTSKQLRQCLLL